MINSHHAALWCATPIAVAAMTEGLASPAENPRRRSISFMAYE